MNNKIIYGIIAVAFVGGMFTVAYAGPIMPKITLSGDVDVTNDLDVGGTITGVVTLESLFSTCEFLGGGVPIWFDDEEGGEWICDFIGSFEIKNSAIQTGHIGVREVGHDDIAFNSVDAAIIQTDAVTSDKILDGTIQAADIAANAITASELAANAITASELANNAVVGGTVGVIQDNSITAADIATDAIGPSEIAANAVGGSEIIGTSKLIFGTCSSSLSSFPAGISGQSNCSFPGVVPGDQVMATIGSPTTDCFAVVKASVTIADFIAFRVVNACSSTVSASTVTYNVIVFKIP